MTLQDRLNPDPRHSPDNVVPMNRKPQRREKPRWMQWTEEHQTERSANADLTGYVVREAA